MTINVCGDITTIGATLFFAEVEAGPYTEVGAVVSMPDISSAARTAECTDPYGEQADGYVEKYKTGIFDGQDAPFTVKLREGDAIQATLRDYHDGNNKFSACWIRVQLNTTNSWKQTFKSAITEFTYAFPPDGEVATMQLTALVNSKPIET